MVGDSVKALALLLAALYLSGCGLIQIGSDEPTIIHDDSLLPCPPIIRSTECPTNREVPHSNKRRPESGGQLVTEWEDRGEALHCERKRYSALLEDWRDCVRFTEKVNR